MDLRGQPRSQSMNLKLTFGESVQEQSIEGLAEATVLPAFFG